MGRLSRKYKEIVVVEQGFDAEQTSLHTWHLLLIIILDTAVVVIGNIYYSF